MKQLLKIIAAILLLVCLGLMGIFGMDAFKRYSSFRSLSADKVEREAQAYFQENARGQYACAYIVECINDHAHLKRVSNFDDVDWDELKSVIWARKFDKKCTGRTANVGMVLPTNSETISKGDTSRWEFGADGFLSNLGRFQSGSFTDKPYETCTPDKAMFKR